MSGSGKKTVAQPRMVDLAPLRAAQIVPLDCGCVGCRALESEYGSDQHLHLTYRLALLKRGWAGKVTPGEKAFQQAHVDWARQRPGSGMPQFGEKHGVQTAPESEDEESDVGALGEAS